MELPSASVPLSCTLSERPFAASGPVGCVLAAVVLGGVCAKNGNELIKEGRGVEGARAACK